jgi:hypothetical protein
MKTVEAIKPRPLSRKQIKDQTSVSLVIDLLERGIQSPLNALHMMLLQIVDTGLLQSDDLLAGRVESLCNNCTDLVERARKVFPKSYCEARPLLNKCSGLQQEVNLYRQEQFWLRSDRASLLASEELIRDLFGFYASVEEFMYLLASTDEDTVYGKMPSAPTFEPNPYEQ